MPEAGAIAVKSVTGMGTMVGVWTAVIGGGFGLLYIIVRVLPKWRELGIAGDAAFRAELMRRVGALESEIKVMNTLHNAEISVMRHRLNAETHTLDTLILMLEAAPEKSADTILKIKELRREQKENIAKEQAALIDARAAAMRELERDGA